MNLAALVVVAATVIAAGCAETASPRFPAGTVVDLSHAYDAQAIFWPTADPFRLEKVADGVTPAGYYYAANNFFTSEHGGTHVDAPVHFAQGRQTVDEIPLERLMGEAIVVDVAEASARDADYQVTVDDLQRAEAQDADSGERNRAAPNRLLAAMARRGALSRHERARG